MERDDAPETSFEILRSSQENCLMIELPTECKFDESDRQAAWTAKEMVLDGTLPVMTHEEQVEAIKDDLRTRAAERNKVLTPEDVSALASKIIQQVEQHSPMIRFSESEQKRIDEVKGIAAQRVKVSRNAPCPCGSGRKLKRCCMTSHDSTKVQD